MPRAKRSGAERSGAERSEADEAEEAEWIEPWLDSPDSRARQPPDSHQTAQTAVDSPDSQTGQTVSSRCLAGV